MNYNSKINYIKSQIQKLELEWYKAYKSSESLFVTEDDYNDIGYYGYRIKELEAELFNIQSARDEAEFKWYKITVEVAFKTIVKIPLNLFSLITDSITDTVATIIHKLKVLLHTHSKIIINK